MPLFGSPGRSMAPALRPVPDARCRPASSACSRSPAPCAGRRFQCGGLVAVDPQAQHRRAAARCAKALEAALPLGAGQLRIVAVEAAAQRVAGVGGEGVLLTGQVQDARAGRGGRAFVHRARLARRHKRGDGRRLVDEPLRAAGAGGSARAWRPARRPAAGCGAGSGPGSPPRAARDSGGAREGEGRAGRPRSAARRGRPRRPPRSRTSGSDAAAGICSPVPRQARP